MVDLGIDIGGTSIKAALVVDGRCVRAGQSGFYVRPTADQLRSAITAAVGDVGDVGTVGLCVPGVLTADRRAVTLAVNVPGLVGLPLDQLVPHALGLVGDRPTVVCNDAAAAALDVQRARRLRGRLLVLTLGTGVGNAVMDPGGVLLVLGGGASGHLGQIDVTLPGDEDVVGPDGGAGGLEGYLGVAALRRRYGPDVSAAVAAFDGTEPAVRALARAIRIAHAVYRPDHVCLCGGIGTRLGHLLPALRRLVDDRLSNIARPGWTLSCGDDDYHAARGAAAMAAAAAAAVDRPASLVAR